MRLVRALTMAALLLVGSATAAAAAPPIARDITWTSCPATAELIELRALDEHLAVLDYVVDFGSCPVSAGTYYALVSFSSSGGFGTGVAVATTVNGPAVGSVSLTAQPAAVCLVTSRTDRTACRAIVDAEGGAALGEVLAPDSPLVSAPFIIQSDPVGPRCPTCW